MAGWTSGRILILIVLSALALRLLGAWSAALVFDERAHWALAETIALRPGHIHLVSRTLDHPLLSIYVLKLGSLALGTSDFALRLPYVLAGAGTIVPIYYLGKRAYSSQAGLWAAGLLAVDQFHAGWSRVFMPEVLMLLLASLAALQFLRLLERPSAANGLLLGVVLGLAYLAKEPAIVLLPAMWAYLVITPQHRPLTWQGAWWLMHAVFLLVVAPDIVWNAARSSESYFARDALLVSQPLAISLKPVGLYLGDWFRWLIDPEVFGSDYVEGNLYTCQAVAGAFYLAAVAGAIRFARQAAVRWLLVLFATFFCVFLVLPGGTRYEPFWWPSISLIPAVVCAGGAIDRMVAGHRFRALLAALAIGCLGTSYVAVARNRGAEEPRATVGQFADDFVQKGNDALRRGALREAEGRFIYALNIAGPRADAYFGRASVAWRLGRRDQVRRMVERCLALDPDHAGAIELRKALQEP